MSYYIYIYICSKRRSFLCELFHGPRGRSNVTMISARAYSLVDALLLIYKTLSL